MTAYQITYAVPTVPTPIDPAIAARAIGLSVGKAEADISSMS